MIPSGNILEIGSAILFLILGVWATMYGYGLAGGRLFGRWQWNAGFRMQLRWLGPLLVVLCVASIMIILR
jgi:hypothetical protein